MRPLEIESWALRVLERVENHLPVEDVRVEVKTSWIDPVKAARRIAGHANAARGETILWIIGADEKQGLVTGANYQDLASWFPPVKACFESVIPALQDLNVTYKGKTVAALCFDTSRFPYVIKNPAFGTRGGEFELEVPWREGTAVRSATRSDLVLLISPLVRMPKVEILSGELRCEPKSGTAGPFHFMLRLVVYVVPLDSTPFTIPFHKCTAIVSFGNDTITDLMKLEMDSPSAKRKKEIRAMSSTSKFINKDSAPRVDVRVGNEAIEGTSDEVVIRGAGKIEIDGDSATFPVVDWPELNLSLMLVEAVTESKITLNARFLRHGNRGNAQLWVLAK